LTGPTLAVVIVNWNSREDVLAGIHSLRHQPSFGLDIVVVDNGSSDGSVGAIRREFPDVRVIESGTNLGFAEGCNRGIKATSSEWVFLLNNDAAVAPSCMAELRRAAAGAPEDVGMIQPMIVFATKPTHVNSSGVVVFRTGQARDRHFAEPVLAATSAEDPFCSSAGAALYRRSMLERVQLGTGYLGRDFFMYFEDVDLGWRCRLAGYRAIYVPDARVLHRFQGSSRRRGNAFVTTQCRINRIAMMVHNASIGFILRSWIVTAYEVKAILQEVGVRPLLDLLRRLPTLITDRIRIGRMSRIGRRQLERAWCAQIAPTMPNLDFVDRPE
jgi:GT2 family glycosyltransferase